MIHDFLGALRSLRRHPWFTLLTLLSLGLAVGATVAVFDVVDAVLLGPLPFPNADRLVELSQRTIASDRLSIPLADVPDLRRETSVFEGVGARALAVSDVMVQIGGGQPEYATALMVSHDYLPVLGVQPYLGRLFTLQDAVPEAESEEGATSARGRAVVLTYGLWERAFGADPGVLDRPFRIYGSPAHVIGVLPRDFTVRNKRRHGWVSGNTADLFLTWPERVFTSSGARPGPRGLLPVARLRAGVTYDRARSALETLAARLRADHPGYAEEEMHYGLVPEVDEWRASYRPALFVVAGGVFFLLLLVCANLANLILVRSWTQAGEDAVRSALGCGRGRLVTQKLGESLALAVGGGAVGLGVAWIAVKVLDAIAPGNIPVLHRVGVSAPVVVGSLGTATLLVVLCALIPATHVLHRLDLAQILASEVRGAGGRRRRTAMNGLVVAEVLLSMLLLSGATVMVRTLFAMATADHGFQSERTLTFEVSPYAPEFRGRERRAVLYAEVEERLMALPGVEAVGRSSMVPFSGRVWNGTYARDRDSYAQSTDWADFIVVSDGYFRAMGTRLLAGRYFTAAEMEDSTESIMVDSKLAAITWPGRDPVGRRLAYDLYAGVQEGVVVGVVQHMLMTDFGAESREAIFLPEGAFGGGAAGSFAVRTALPVEAVAPALRRVLQSIHPTLVPYKIQKLSDRVDLSLAPTRFVAVAMGTFAALALLVAVFGLFGVVAYSVRTRTVELGIRQALGAERSDIMALVLRQGALLSAAGIVGGGAGALLLARFMESMVFGVSPASPLVLALSALLLATATLLACWMPARWACRVDPVRSLRGE